MKDEKSGQDPGKNKDASSRSNPKQENIVNEQEQQHPVNQQQELHEQDRPSGDYVSEREMSRESQEKADTEQPEDAKSKDLNKKQTASETNAENAKEDFQQ
jgi:hypothetical protein